MTTERQKKAVSFCESMCNVEFTGDIDNHNDVSAFLSVHLDNAKALHEECMSIDYYDISGYV